VLPDVLKGEDSGTLDTYHRQSGTEAAPATLQRSGSSGVLRTAVEALLHMRTDHTARSAADDDDDQSSCALQLAHRLILPLCRLS
jgi:hypothetical protein